MGRKQRRNRLPKAHPKFNAPRETPAGIWPGDRTRFLTLAGIALVAVLTFGIYGQTVSVPTIDYEDSFYLVRNPYVNVPDPFSRLVAVWTEPYFANFHPVTTTTWLVDRAFADRLQSFDAYPFRITHLLYAITGAALLIVLFLQLGLPPPLAITGAFLFAVHPIHTEVVAWLSARKDLMALIALVLACILLSAREGEPHARRMAARAFPGGCPGLARRALQTDHGDRPCALPGL